MQCVGGCMNGAYCIEAEFSKWPYVKKCLLIFAVAYLCFGDILSKKMYSQHNLYHLSYTVIGPVW